MGCFAPPPLLPAIDDDAASTGALEDDSEDGMGGSGTEPEADTDDEAMGTTGEADASGDDSSTGDPSTPDDPPPMVDALWRNDFDDDPLGAYSANTLAADWNDPEWFDGIVQERVSIIEDPMNLDRSLRVRFPAGAYGGDSASSWLLRFDEPHDELWVSYRLRLDEDFDFVNGGRVPGLIGGALVNNSVPNGADGWSTRGSWRSDGAIATYTYHMDQPESYGEHFEWDQPHGRYFERGQWTRVEHHVRMNTPGDSDGLVECWLDGELALRVEGLRFRETDELAIDAFYFNTFFGGGSPEDAPSEEQQIDFDDFVVAAEPIGPGW